MPGSNEWGQYYQQAFMDNEQATPTNGRFSDTTIGTTSSNLVTESNCSPSSLHTGGGGQLTPTRSVSKPIRRRSRVSKKTPITLLNANANNFRALVQQFTGCATFSSPISLGNQKGPINLSFGLNSNVTSSVMAPFGNHNYSYQYQQQLQRLAQPSLQVEQPQQRQQPFLQLQENQQFHQEQPIDNNVSGSQELFQYSLSSGYNPIPNLETADGFAMDQEDIALHDFYIDLERV